MLCCPAAFAAFFALVSAYNRLDFTITRDERWQEEQAKDKALGILQQLVAVWDGEHCFGMNTMHTPRFINVCAAATFWECHICRV